MASGIVQATGQWVADQLKKLQTEAELRRTEIAMNNGRIVAADKRAQSIADPVRRKAVRDELHKMAQRQATIAKAYRIFGAKVVSISKSARSWLSANGYASQLSGLGVIQIPTAIVVALSVGAVVWVSNSWLANANRAQANAAKQFETITGLITAGTTTPDQAIALLGAANKSADANMPKGDPFGLANMAAAATPLAAIVLAALVLPPLLEAFNNSRKRRVA